MDNIIVKNTAFVNVANYMESSAPEEVSGVNFTGNVESYSRNLYVADCTINGLSPVNKNGLGRYAIIGKYAGEYVCQWVPYYGIQLYSAEIYGLPDSIAY